MIYACRKCTVTLISLAARRTHTRTVHQTFCNVNEGDGTRRRVLRSNSLHWKCPYPSCLLSFSRSDRLQSHYSHIHAQGNGSHTDEESTRGDASLPTAAPDFQAQEERPNSTTVDVARETPELIRRASLCVIEYNSMTLLYCKSCDAMVDGSNAKSTCNHVRTHFRSDTGEKTSSGRRGYRSWNRGRTWSRVQLDDLEGAVRAIPFTPLHDLVRWLSVHLLDGTASRIPLLRVRDGFRCSYCPYYGVDRKVMANHRRAKHRSDPHRFSATACRVQTLVRGFGIKYFGVRCPPESGPPGSDGNGQRWNALLSKIAALRVTVSPRRDPPPRQLSPWLRKSKWTRHAAALIPEDASYERIKGAMKASKDRSDPYARVQDVLHAYATVLQTKVLPEAEFRFRRAVALDTVKGFMDFMTATTVKDYVTVAQGFIIALLRSACDAPGSDDFITTVVAPDYMKAALLALKSQLVHLPQGTLPDEFDCLPIHKVLLALWTPEQNPMLKARLEKDCLFLQYLILYCIKPCDGHSRPAYSWMPIHDITRALTHLKFWCRATIEMELCREIWRGSAATSMTVADGEKLLLYTDESLVLRETPFSYISSLGKLASSMAGDTSRKPKLMSSDPSSCNIGGYDIHIDRIRSMIKALLQDCNAIMRHQVLLGLNTDWIRELLERRTPILDAVNSTTHGYSFIADPKNPFLGHQNDLLRHMFDHQASYFVSRYDAEGRIENFNERALRSWMAACEKLEDLIGLLLHLTCSQPPRGQEYESFLVRNTATGERSFFWSEETMVIYQDYNKTDGGRKDKPKLIARFLPHCMRQLLLEYLALVRPVQVAVAAEIWGGKEAALYQDLWFVQRGRVGDPQNISRVMRREFTKHCGAPVGLRRYRHLTAFFSSPIHAEVQELQKEPFADSAGHSRHTEGLMYGQNMCDIRSIGRDRWRAFKFVAIKWQRHLHLPDSDSSDPPHAPPPRIPGSTTFDVPAQGTPASNSPEVEIEFLPPEPKRKRLYHDCDSGLQQMDPLELIDPHAIQWAEAALGRCGYRGWKIPQQGVATAMALENRRDFIAILPTGSGKSFVYMAPAMATQKTVVVIVPLVMLITDHITDCETRGITCAEFRVGAIDPTCPPRLVFVPVEIAVQEGFQVWAKQLISAGGLHSVFVDEVHLVLANYRAKMAQLFLLSSLDCQMIGLTASLAPGEEVQVKSRLGRNFAIVRSKTTRPNLQYRVQDVDDMDAEIAGRLQTWLAAPDRAPEDRALVYCMTRREVETLHGYLASHGVPNSFLHAHLETTSDKVLRLRSWEQGDTVVMVTTSVLGCGYNYQAVRLVLHRGSCFTLAGFHQESGRGGRDGKMTICHVISSPQFRRSMETGMERRVPGGGREAAAVLSCFKQTNQWIEDNDNCRRFNLHRVLDGVAQVCAFLPGALGCDVCTGRRETYRPRQPGPSHRGSSWENDTSLLEDLAPPEAAVARPTTTRRNTLMLEDLEALRLVRRRAGDGNQCLLCHRSHPIRQCPRHKGRCLRCLDIGHTVYNCPIKQSMLAYTFDRCCHRCYFQLDAVGDDTVHKWSVDAKGTCDDKSGERIRILIWSAYRSDENAALKRRFPGMPFRDTELEPWLYAKEPDHMLNTFVRVAAAIIADEHPGHG